jgi:hypothetical protein
MASFVKMEVVYRALSRIGPTGERDDGGMGFIGLSRCCRAKNGFETAFKWLQLAFKWLLWEDIWRIHAENWVRFAKTAFSIGARAARIVEWPRRNRQTDQACS